MKLMMIALVSVILPPFQTPDALPRRAVLGLPFVQVPTDQARQYDLPDGVGFHVQVGCDFGGTVPFHGQTPKRGPSSLLKLGADQFQGSL